MKVFLSSVIVGLEEFRDAADRASRTLGHEVIRAEQFGASPATPQRTCLAGVRDADLVVLILGSSYGSLQDSGLSATHEEYMEARDEKQVLVFVCAGEMEERQQHLLQEVREWSSGHYTATFNTTEEFAEKVTRALHDHELSTATGPVDESEVIARAMELIHTDRSLGGGGVVADSCCGRP